MSLFDSASLVVTPNGYKAGKLYSIKPTSGAGDLDVVRATSATRVNASGLIEIPRTNLLLRSEEFDNASWVKTASTVTANATTSPSGTMTADKLVENNTNASHFILQSTGSLVVGNTYFVSIYLKAAERNRGRLRVNGASAIEAEFNLQNGTVSVGNATNVIIQNVGNDWYRFGFSFVANATTMSTVINLSNSTTGNSGFNYTYLGDNTSGMFIWGAQLELGNVATEYIPTTSVIRTRFAGITQDGGSANNIPRLDYTNASCPSILVEPQRTNLLLRSEEFDNVYWAKTRTTIIQNSTIAPDGSLTADKLIDDTTTSATHQISRSVAVASGAHTMSVFAKKGEYNFIRFWEDVQTGRQAFFNLDTGVATNVNMDSVSIVDFGNGWYRCIATINMPSAGNFGFRINLTPNGTTTVYNGTGTNGVFLWGAQLEAGANATSYIPTQASTVTRNTDVISKTGITDLIGQTEGTMYAEVRVSRLLGVASRYIFHLSDGTSNNRIYIAFSGASSNILRARIFNGGVLQANIESSTITTLGTFKLALAYNNNDIVFYINGVQIGTDTSATIPTCSRVDVGHNQAGASQFNDSINSALIFPTRLSNTELAQLTTL